MIELTPDARKRFDDYLQRTRSALRGTRAIEATDKAKAEVVVAVELVAQGATCRGVWRSTAARLTRCMLSRCFAAG